MTGQNAVKRLCKSRSDRMIDGVCGGIAEYFAIDATLVRIAFVLMLLAGGVGFILYLVSMIIMPKAPAEQAEVLPSHRANTVFWGVLLTLAGVIWLLSNLGFSLFHHWWDIPWRVLLPVALLLAGAWFLLGGRNYVSAAPPLSPREGQPVPEAPARPVTRERLYRSRGDKKIFGVCSGLGSYFGIDPVIVRILFVIAAFASWGFAALLYLVLAIVVPWEPLSVEAPR